MPLGLILAVSGCGGNQNTLHAASHQQSSIVHVFWVMFGVACLGFGVIVLLLFVGWARRERPGLLGRGDDDRLGTRLVVVLGVAMPIVLLSVLFVWADIFVVRTTEAPAARLDPADGPRDRAPVVVGDPLSGDGRSDGERAPHPDRTPASTWPGRAPT